LVKRFARRPINAYQVELWQELCARQAYEMRQIRRRVWQLFQLRGKERLKAVLGLFSSAIAYIVVSVQASEAYDGVLTEDE
jgi:hypothetical protein